MLLLFYSAILVLDSVNEPFKGEALTWHFPLLLLVSVHKVETECRLTRFEHSARRNVIDDGTHQLKLSFLVVLNNTHFPRPLSCHTFDVMGNVTHLRCYHSNGGDILAALPTRRRRKNRNNYALEYCFPSYSNDRSSGNRLDG